MGGRFVATIVLGAFATSGCGVAAAPAPTAASSAAPVTTAPTASAGQQAGTPASVSPTPVVLPTKRPTPTATWKSTAPEAPVTTPFTVDGVVLVNRVHPLASSYVPPWSKEANGLAPEMTAALKLMFADAKSRGMTLQVRSGYRSYSDQAAAYNNAKGQYDAKTLDLYFAKPGMSEHQTGLAADLTDAAGHRGDDFLATPEATYLAEHATDFGFIIRYPLNRTDVTGYSWEPWHVRYVGTEVAAYFAQHPGLTLEEYLGQA